MDTGTDSLGWAIVEREEETDGKDEEGTCTLVGHGVSLFQEGVKEEKGIESSRATERTGHRRLRIGYYRDKLRKIRLLKVLSDNHLCPPLTKEELRDWRLKKIYPKDELFMQWQATEERTGENPYFYRHKCLHEKLDMNDLTQRYMVGRALYHLNQRRGFLSNRKEEADEKELGKVKEDIGALNQEMAAAGCEYLGDYFYDLYNKGEKIRGRYTSRKEHYEKELLAICEKQKLGDELTKKLHNVIIRQRDLKSKKGEVGKCTFEKNKYKCPVSHPLFEEYRMLTFLNNIKIKTIFDADLRELDDEERAIAKKKFFRKTDFKFEDIAKAIVGKGNYGFYKNDKDKDKPYLFNYPMDMPVSCCSVTEQLMSLFGNDWVNGICEVYVYKENKKPKSKIDIINDVWHALFSFSDNEKLEEFAKRHLQLNDEDTRKFAAIKMPQGYASLSLKAIKNILFFLRRGLIYSHSVFLANLGDVLPHYIWNMEETREAAIDNLIDCIKSYKKHDEGPTLEDFLKSAIANTYGVEERVLNKLYHPSMIDTYPHQRPDADNIYQLGSPRTNSVRNPMVMRSLFRLRKLINRLLKEKKIDENTIVNIELARDLNDANMRKAIKIMNLDNQKKNEERRKNIIDLYKKETGRDIVPTDTDVLKFKLWEEQDHHCIYTGNEISISEFIGPNPSYDIEHTIPRSAGGDSTDMNLTLCSNAFNREVKKTKLPSQLSNHSDILQRIDNWKKKYEKLAIEIKKFQKGHETMKDMRDRRIQNKHLRELEYKYWKGKYDRFTMTEVPEGFSRRQGTDNQVISRFARLYLKSVFKHVHIVKGIATRDFRVAWGLQREDEKKPRINHIHHCIDAVVIACIGRNEYNKLARFYHEREDNDEYSNRRRPFFPKPWPTFTEDVKNLQDDTLIAHYTPDNMPKQGRRYVKVGSKKVLCKGDAARGSLHLDTYYGAIKSPKTGEIKYVKRIMLSSLTSDKDVKNIIDDVVRAKVMKAIEEKGFTKAMAEPIWMNEEKRIPIKKVRVYATTVKDPIHIRLHRDLSTKEYKRQFHVVNDRNYLMAIYIGKNSKGKEKRDFVLVNNLQAATYFKTSNKPQREQGQTLVPATSKNGFPLAFTLKIGTMLLLYENSPEEIWTAPKKELVKRLYKVTRLEKDGRLHLVFHQEARKSEDLNNEMESSFSVNAKSPRLRIRISKLNALVQGYDFNLTETGEIIRLR